MKYSKKTLFALVAATALAGAAMAQESTPGSPQGPMDHDRMMQGGSGAMPMMGMMQQMSAMMENCNKMMQSVMDRHQGAPAQPQPQGNRG